MKIVYRVEMQDIVAFNQYNLEDTGTLKSLRLKTIVIGCVIIAVLGGWQYRVTESIDPIITGAIFAIIFSTWILKRDFRVSPKKIQKIYGGDTNKGVLCQHQIELVDDGLIESTSLGEQKTTYSGIEKIDQTDTHGFIFIGTMNAHTIPRDGVIEGDFDEFMKVITDLREMGSGNKS